MNTTTTKRPGFWLRAIEYRKHELLREQRRAFRDSLADQAREGISDEDYATTMATLEKMARNLGYDGEEVPRRGFGPGHPFAGPGHHGRPFGPRRFRRHDRDERPFPTEDTEA